MPHSIKIKLSSDNIIKVKICSQDVLGLPRGTSKYFSQRADYQAATVDHDIVRVAIAGICNGMVRRIVFLGRELTRRKHETTSFECDVSHRAFPSLTRINRWDAIDLRPERVIIGSDWRKHTV